MADEKKTDSLEWPCPKCGCSHELEKGLHERWGCYLDTDENRRDGIEWRKSPKEMKTVRKHIREGA